jgi:hypothetical protein
MIYRNNPHLEPKSSKILKMGGSDSRAQDAVFKALSMRIKPCLRFKHSINSSSISFAEIGYNKGKFTFLKSICIFCSMTQGFPQ